MKKQPFNNRQYIIAVLAILGLMFVQYTFAAKFDLEALKPEAIFKPLFKVIDDNIIYVCTLAAGIGAAISQGDLRTRSQHGVLGLLYAAGAWGATKTVTNIPALIA